MQRNKICIRTHDDSKDPNQFFVNVEAPAVAAAMESVKQVAAQATVQGWKHFDEIMPAWIKWWPHSHQDQTETMSVTAYEETD
jgi:hypothetical protein